MIDRQNVHSSFGVATRETRQRLLCLGGLGFRHRLDEVLARRGGGGKCCALGRRGGGHDALARERHGRQVRGRWEGAGADGLGGPQRRPWGEEQGRLRGLQGQRSGRLREQRCAAVGKARRTGGRGGRSSGRHNGVPLRLRRRLQSPAATPTAAAVRAAARAAAQIAQANAAAAAATAAAA